MASPKHTPRRVGHPDAGIRPGRKSSEYQRTTIRLLTEARAELEALGVVPGNQAAQVNRPRGPIAILATDPAIYGRACTFATLGRATLTVEVFRDLGQAEEWLSAKLTE